MMQGLPGSYSEDAALKAYPNCKSVPCNEFEDAFKVYNLSARLKITSRIAFLSVEYLTYFILMNFFFFQKCNVIIENFIPHYQS